MLQTPNNLILATDSYKVGHHFQYPPFMEFMSDFMTSRGGMHTHVVPFGLQYKMLHYLTKAVTMSDVNEAEFLFKAHFGTSAYFPRAAWEHVVKKWGGRIPIRIRAVPEGTVVPVGAPILQVESMDPKAFFLPSWFEGLLQKVWYPTTIATLDFHTKLELAKFLAATSDNMDGLPFMLHDFGYRGASSDESAAIGGGAALVNFMGTDTVPALKWLKDYYYADEMPGFSVAAAEHSTITAWGREGEVDAYRNILRRFGNQNIVAVVSDSYDIYNAVENIWGEVLRREVQDMKATLVVRPDSGNPVEVVANVATLLDAKFGSTRNSKGYKVLNNVRVIQGDGIGHDGQIAQILTATTELGFSADNFVFGMGGGRLQKMDRDTQKFAIKCSLIKVDGQYREVYKDPITDPGKASARGYVDVIEGFFGPEVVSGLTGPHPQSLMRTVFEAGDVLVVDDLALIRARTQREFDRRINVGAML